MTRTLSGQAKVLLANARNLSGAADFLSAGNSTFGKWAVPGLLPQQGTAVIYSPTGSGKTFFALHLALCKAAALPWFGAPMQGGTVVYLVTEDRPGVEARAVAAARHMELPLDDVAFEFVTPWAIHADGWADGLIEVLTEIQTRNEQPIVAVFLDTLGASFGGRSQDDAAQMTLATDAMQTVAEHFKCNFVAIHHSGKDEARGMRGSQVLKDRVDTVITLSKIKTGGISINVEKQRNGAIGAPLSCRLTGVDVITGPGQTERTCVVTQLAIVTASSPMIAPADSKPAKLSGDERAVLKAIKAAAEPITVRNFGILTKDTLIATKPRKDGAVRTAISHVKQQLLFKKYIEIDEKTETVRICQKASELEIF
jgi:hypothetical protein